MELISKVFSKSNIWSVFSVIVCLVIAYFFSAINDNPYASPTIIVADTLLVTLIFTILSTEFSNGFHLSFGIGRRQVSIAVTSLIIFSSLDSWLLSSRSGITVTLLSLLLFAFIIYLVSIVINKESNIRFFKFYNFFIFVGLYMIFAVFIYFAYTDFGNEELRMKTFHVVKDFHSVVEELF